MFELSRLLRPRRFWIVIILVIGAAAFRIAVAHWLPNDEPGDGKVYAQIARNVLEQHTYSHATEPPYEPSIIRLPGYPLFLAAIYKVFGHGNNGAVRMVQALIDTGTCALVALLAFYWEPDEKRKRAAAVAALALAVVCPFTTIYAATILTEVPTMFLAMAMCVAATLAFRSTLTTEDTEESQRNRRSFERSLLWWCIAGLLAGMAVLLRPDSGLFAAAIGVTLVLTSVGSFWSAVASVARHRFGLSIEISQAGHPKRRRRFALPAHSTYSWTLAAGSVFSLAFALVLVPWTIRNARVFHLFQPLAPAHGEMPGEFVPRGYNTWLRTWLDDERYIGPFLWSFDEQQIDIDDLPPQAFDSAEEKTRVAVLLDKYNHPPESESADNKVAQPPQQTPPSPAPQASPAPLSINPKTLTGKSAKATDQSAKTSNANQPANANANNNTEGASDENDNAENSDNDQGDQGDNSDESDQVQDHGPVEMTPEIDAGFAQIARERVARHPIRFYFWLPIKRAQTMWFDTHSQYWPFEGDLLPLEDLDYEEHQQIWLPLFAGLTLAYTLLGIAGAWLLWRSREGRKWLLLLSLIILFRLTFFSTIENPEPRYVVEFFPFLAVLGGLAVAQIPWRAGKSAP
jgi:hypothetical protein